MNDQTCRNQLVEPNNKDQLHPGPKPSYQPQKHTLTKVCEWCRGTPRQDNSNYVRRRTCKTEGALRQAHPPGMDWRSNAGSRQNPNKRLAASGAPSTTRPSGRVRSPRTASQSTDPLHKGWHTTGQVQCIQHMVPERQTNTDRHGRAPVQ